MVNLVLGAGALGFLLGLLLWGLAFVNLADALRSIGSATPTPAVAGCEAWTDGSDSAGTQGAAAKTSCEEASPEKLSGGPR